MYKQKQQFGGMVKNRLSSVFLIGIMFFLPHFVFAYGIYPFGGMYNSSAHYNNALTGAETCPAGYTSQQVQGASGGAGIYWCYQSSIDISTSSVLLSVDSATVDIPILDVFLGIALFLTSSWLVMWIFRRFKN